MYRSLVIAASLGFTAIVANAGQIQVGGSTGLTAGYVGGGSGAFGERNYDTRLYATSVPDITPSLSSGTYTRFGGQTAGSTITDMANGITFSLISDGCNGAVYTCPGGTGANNNSNNFWESTGLGSITVPVGVFGVTDVWTMLNDVWGTPSTQNGGVITPSSNTTVTFNFGTSANATTFVDVVQVTLANALAGVGSQPYGQIRAGIDCTSVGTSSCNSFANGPLAPSSGAATSINGAPASPTQVVTNNLYSQAYTSIGNAASPYAGSTGNGVLDDQGFLFGSAYANLFLVNVQISNNNGALNGSHTALSAITVNTAATPEPSTMFLLMSGLGAIGISCVRRRR